MAALDRLQAASTSLVLATHDVDLALAWADEVAVVVGGVVLQGDPARVLADADLVGRARLARPWVLSVLARLTECGIVPGGATARDEESLLALLPCGDHPGSA
jgi:cobalt/nickel transport system ATP-binding protein